MNHVLTAVAAACMAASLSCGGPEVTEAPAEPVALASGARKPLRVALVLADGLESATWSNDFNGQIETTSLGRCLAANCEAVARAVFSQVDGPIVAGQKELPAGRATLTARLAGVARTRPPSNLSSQRTTLRLEWRLRSPGGRLVWAQSISVTGEGPMSRDGYQEQLRLAVEGLFQRSLAAMRQSPEIALAAGG